MRSKNATAKKFKLESKADDISLTYEVAKRLLDLADFHLYTKGSPLIVPSGLQADYDRFIKVKQRHMAQDYRHTEAEMRSVKAIAQWSCDVNCELRNQPRKEIAWKD